MSDTPSNEELLSRITALEDKVSNSLLMMKRTPDSEYEKLVDVVCDHESKINNINRETELCMFRQQHWTEQGPVSSRWEQSGLHFEQPAPAPAASSRFHVEGLETHGIE